MALKKRIITIEIPEDAAERLQNCISDWGCWSSGFRYGVRTEECQPFDFIPSMDPLRALRERIQDELKELEADND